MNIGLLSNFQQSLVEFCSFFYKSCVVGLESFNMWLDSILVEWRLADVKLGFLQTFCRVQKVGEEALNERQRLDAERLSKTELVQPEGLKITKVRPWQPIIWRLQDFLRSTVNSYMTYYYFIYFLSFIRNYSLKKDIIRPVSYTVQRYFLTIWLLIQ